MCGFVCMKPGGGGGKWLPLLYTTPFIWFLPKIKKGKLVLNTECKHVQIINQTNSREKITVSEWSATQNLINNFLVIVGVELSKVRNSDLAVSLN